MSNPAIGLAPHPLQDPVPVTLWFAVGALGGSTMLDYREDMGGASGSFIDWAAECGMDRIEDFAPGATRLPGLYVLSGTLGWSRTSHLEFRGQWFHELVIETVFESLAHLATTPDSIDKAGRSA